MAGTADIIAGKAPLTVKAMKFIASQVLEPDPVKRDLETCGELVSEFFALADYFEGRTTFLEKRRPNFSGT